MAARVIHYGPDACHRRMVLRCAGYLVEDCGALDQLGRRLSESLAADAVVTSDAGEVPAEEVILVAKLLGPVPVVLFRETNRPLTESSFDLVVPSLTPPAVWLREIDALIAGHGRVWVSPPASRLPVPEASTKPSSPLPSPRLK